jgi:F-type H+-transporting ATPase subunit alpha
MYLDEIGEIGKVQKVNYPILQVDGLPRAFPQELVLFENGDIGQVTSTDPGYVSVLTFSQDPPKPGTRTVRTGEVVKIPVGEALLGKSLNPMGKSLYDTRPLPPMEEKRSVDTQPLGIDMRGKISEPLETGVSVVDLMVPLGKGQRELVVGDRKTGKTNFLLQTILTQSLQGTICIYAGIGKKKTDIRHIEQYLDKNNLRNSTVLVVASASDSAGIIYLAPYTAMTIAEYFKDRGKNVLVVLDDMTNHAKFYREISLLAENFPGRNSYPGDIFYTHSRLIERAGNFKTENGNVSITCLPVAETVEGDISGYIQTNLMSMTDGHIYFDSGLFAKGRRPAVNFFLSVTRVGRQTQTSVRSGLNRELNSFLSLHEKTQSFIHFGAELSEGVKTTLELGNKVIDFFNQSSDTILDSNLQVMLFCLIWVGTWNNLTTENTRIELEKIITAYEDNSAVRDMFADYINNAPDFNALLGRISTEQKDILKKLKSFKGKKDTTNGA